MKVFVSYAREDRPLAERINAALNAAGFDTFLDTKELPPGQEFNARIKGAVDDSDIFIFLASQDSVSPGSYTLTELAFAESKWRNPAGYVLPVVIHDFDMKNLPTYLRSINALVVRGSLEAEVVGWVEERAAGGGGGASGLTTEERLKKWARLSQPPIRKARRRIPRSSIRGTLFAIFTIFLIMIIITEFTKFSQGEGDGFLVAMLIGLVAMMLIGLATIVFGLFRAIQGLRGGIKPVAAAVLDREAGTVHLQTVSGKQLRLEPVTKAARNVYPGDLGWAYVSGGLLMDFIAGSSRGASHSEVGNAHAEKRLGFSTRR